MPDDMAGLGAQAFELWAVPGGGDPLVRVLYNKEELPLDGLPPGERPSMALITCYCDSAGNRRWNTDKA